MVGRHDGGDEVVEVTEGRGGELEGAEADVVQGLVVEEERLVGVLDELVDREHAVVRLDDGVRHLGRREDRVGAHDAVGVLLADLGDEEGAHAGAGAATERVGDLEALEAVAALGLLADDVEDGVDELGALGVVALGPVVAGARLAEDEVVRAEDLAEGARADRVHGARLEVHQTKVPATPAASETRLLLFTCTSGRDDRRSTRSSQPGDAPTLGRCGLAHAARIVACGAGAGHARRRVGRVRDAVVAAAPACAFEAATVNAGEHAFLRACRRGARARAPRAEPLRAERRPPTCPWSRPTPRAVQCARARVRRPPRTARPPPPTDQREEPAPPAFEASPHGRCRRVADGSPTK